MVLSLPEYWIPGGLRIWVSKWSRPKRKKENAFRFDSCIGPTVVSPESATPELIMRNSYTATIKVRELVRSLTNSYMYIVTMCLELSIDRSIW